MKTSSLVLLACTLAIPSFAQEAKTNAAPEPGSATGKVAASTQTFLAAAGTLSAPFKLQDGYISQPEQTEPSDGGKAIYNFTITNAGDYIIRGMVNAPAEDANSFYLNVDALPEDPMMIWDLDITVGFEERTGGWRGNGSADSGEFIPKRFKLSVGAHKLFIVGREGGAQLKSVSIRPAD